jgi:hypothetical protein
VPRRDRTEAIITLIVSQAQKRGGADSRSAKGKSSLVAVRDEKIDVSNIPELTVLAA